MACTVALDVLFLMELNSNTFYFNSMKYMGKNEPYFKFLFVMVNHTIIKWISFNCLRRFSYANRTNMKNNHFIICKCARKLEIKGVKCL